MKKSRTPTSKEINKLTDFLPILYAEGFSPVERWMGGRVSEDFFMVSSPIYKEVVNKFFELLAEDQWNDYSYQPAIAAEMLKDEDFVKRASLEEIKTMLTYCWRGERFCEGHWEGVIKDGYVQRLLERLIKINTKK